jgi:YVTN family beta-propeller protein
MVRRHLLAQFAIALMLIMALSAPSRLGAQKPKLFPVTDRSHRSELEGASVLPPEGKDWVTAIYFMDHAHSVYFGREVGRDNTVVAQLSGVWVPMPVDSLSSPDKRARFLRRAAETKHRSGDGPGLRMISFDSGPDSLGHAQCEHYQYEVEMEKRGLISSSTLMLTEHGLLCLHPSEPRLFYALYYSQRFPKGQSQPDLATQLDPFMKSLAFTPFTALASESIIVDGGPQGIAVGGDVWVGRINGASVVRIDPRKLAVIAKIPVGRLPVGVAVGEGAVWVANEDDGTVSRIDPATNQVTATIKVGRQPVVVATSPGAVWVVNRVDGTVTRIDPSSNSVVGKPIEVGNNPSGIAADDHGVWVSVAREGSLRRIDPQSNTVAKPIKAGHFPVGVAIGEGSVWVVSREDSTVLRIDPATSKVVGTFPVGAQTNTIAVANGFLWALSTSEGRLWQVDIASGHVVGEPTPVGMEPIFLAAGENAIWVAAYGSDAVVRVGMRTSLPRAK